MLKQNILANYVSQIYVTIIGIALLPMYIQYMGAEAYGLVGFFAMLQAWFGVLDLGLTPTIGRETARFKGGAISALTFRQLYRSLSVVFSVVAILGGLGLLLSSKTIAIKWLNLDSLAVEDVVFSVQVMSVSVALRWMTGLYRGVITGSEKLVWLSAFNAFIATARFVGVFVSMWHFGFTPIVFFFHQLFVALVEIIGLGFKSSQLLPSKNSLTEAIGWSFKPVKSVLKFSLTIAFTASVWVFVTQTDKLILSGILSLKEYGYFTLAVLVASGIMVISGPISSALMPRMARLWSECNHNELILVYRKSTRLVSAIAGSAALVVAFCAKPILLAWTGDLELTDNVAPILRLYAIGNGLLALSAFPYYLQYALGNLRYHLIGNSIMIVVLIPLIVYVAKSYGSLGAGWVWVGVNTFYFLFWVAYTHKKLMPRLHFDWLSKDILLILLPTTIMLSFLTVNTSFEDDQLTNIFVVLGFSSLAVFISCSTMLISKYISEHNIDDK